MEKGAKMSDAHRQKLREGWARRNAAGLPGSRKGIPQSEETRRLISQRTRERTARGPDHYAWKGGTKALKQGDRGTATYRSWRDAVFKRDDYTCLLCTVYLGGGNLEAHHIKSYADFPELRFDVENGVTLCRDHHHLEVHCGEN